MFIFPLKPSRNNFWPCHFLFSFPDFFGIADVLIKAQQIIRTLSLSLSLCQNSWWVGWIESNNCSACAFWICFCVKFLYCFATGNQIKCISTPMNTVTNTLEKNLWGQTTNLWGFWTNHEPTWIHSFMWNLNFPALEEEKVKRHSQLLCWDWKLLSASGWKLNSLIEGESSFDRTFLTSFH